jgi:outer membrane lipopolysaccharide assembly protein LptE/RlpB
MNTKKIISAVGLLSASLFFFGCGYRLSGTGNQIPDHIQSIFIPNFKNNTSLARAEQFVTFALRKEFLRRSKLKLIDTLSSADSSLEGEIAFFEVKPASFSKLAQANLFSLRIRLNVRFIDLKNNKIIFEGRNLNFSQQYEIDTGDFFSQEAQAMEKISDEFASSVVSIILENF